MARTRALEIAVIIPTKNEERYVGEMLKRVEAQVSRRFGSYAIVISDGASSDGTRMIVENAAKSNRHIMFIGHRVQKARGHDVRDAVSKVRANLYFYVDVDLAPSVKHFPDLLAAQRHDCDLVLGSRYMSESPERPPLRLFVSKAYNRVLNLLFRESVSDHQCGFRLFNARMAELVRKESMEEHWMWDTEVVLLALRHKMRVCEVPIKWREPRSRRTPLRRLVGDIYLHGRGILRLLIRFGPDTGS